MQHEGRGVLVNDKHEMSRMPVCAADGAIGFQGLAHPSSLAQHSGAVNHTLFLFLSITLQSERS